jgi:hypothetical protein
MTTTRTARRRNLSVAAYLVLGGAIAVAAWIGGSWPLAVVLGAFYLVTGGVLFWWAGRSGDVAALLRASGDERQRMLDLRATAVSGLAMGAFAIAGAVVQLARGEDANPYAWVCFVGGVSYAIGLAAFKLRG